MKKKVTGVLLLVLVTVLTVMPAMAILGIGDIVYDPTNYAEAVAEVQQLQQQYSQLILTYHMIENQYQQMLWMAQTVPVPMSARYRAMSIPWTPSAATNIYGTTGGWTLGINTGRGITSGYSTATEPLGTYGGAFGNIPSDQLSRMKTNYATVELTDGANLAGIQTIGQLRNNAPAVETAIQNLENDSLSPDPNMNTEIAVLNKINAADVINLRNTQDTNKLLTAVTEEQIIQAKRQRDAEAQAFNNHIQFMTNGRAVMTAQSANASAAMLAWRMP